MSSTFKVRIISGNRVTIPNEEVLALGLKEGDLLEVTVAKVRIAEVQEASHR
ncbi:MAG: AbrB/MazE/SpoVT family DNA-binding domain-containing protein [Nitrososphaerota archaeon]|nr:AbrB/MazE/SpoVT family DNA-binding domain-containing protein [Nitrososphaerota archaeon]